MAKEFKCIRCGIYLGEMTKGKIHKDASVVCGLCMSKFNIAKNPFDMKSSPDVYSIFNRLFNP